MLEIWDRIFFETGELLDEDCTVKSPEQIAGVSCNVIETEIEGVGTYTYYKSLKNLVMKVVINNAEGANTDLLVTLYDETITEFPADVPH